MPAKKIKIDFTPEAPVAAPAVKPAPVKKTAAGKLLLDFTARVWMRDKTHTYLWLRDGYKFGYFLTMDSGSIEIVKIDIFTEVLEPEVKADKKAKIAAKPAVTRDTYRVWHDRETTFDLTPYAYDFKAAVQKYHESHLGRSAAAEREMREILGLPQLADSVTDADLAVQPQERKRAPKGEPKPAAGYTLQQLCEELKLDPTEARKTLRGKKIEKPGARWEWATKEAAAAVIAALS